jgi:hypothetical protein
VPQPPSSSSLLDEILEVQEAGRTGGCTIKSIHEVMEEPDKSAFAEILLNPSVTGAAIAAVLKRRGYMISSHTVQRHRRGVCSCDR